MANGAKKANGLAKVDAQAAWAASEFRTVDLGDARLDQRLVQVVTRMIEHPGASIPKACEGWAETKAAYRFLSNESVDAQGVLAAHREATMARIAQHEVVLAVQDTTFLSLGARPATEGLGPIGVEGSRGIIAHTCLAVSPDGVPLGVLGQHVWTRPADPKRPTEKARRATPTSKKESQRWLDMLKTSTHGWPSGVRVVAVADREADIFAFLQRAIELGQDFLVRSSYDRATTDGYAWDEAERAPLAGTMTVEIPHAGGRPARQATLELRYAKVDVKKPDPRSHHRPGPTVALTMILAQERGAPKGVDPICWRLLTSLPVEGPADAAKCVGWYALRWRIERFFFTLKSGCQIEELQLKTADRWHRALAVFSVVAWRVLALTYAARQAPDAPCEGFLSDDEWQVAYCIANKTTKPPSRPPTLREGVRLVARLGGFLARKGDGDPGVKVLWRGFARLHDLVLAVEYSRLVLTK